MSSLNPAVISSSGAGAGAAAAAAATDPNAVPIVSPQLVASNLPNAAAISSSSSSGVGAGGNVQSPAPPPPSSTSNIAAPAFQVAPQNPPPPAANPQPAANPPPIGNAPPSPAAAAAPSELLTNIIILRDTGRDHGPDFALDNDKIDLDTKTTGIDNNNSITEVLNKLAFLCNTTRDGTKINGKHSISKETYGAHDPDTGKYTNAGNGPEGNTLFGSAPDAPLFDLNTMTAAAAAAPDAVIPQGLLKRTDGTSEIYDAADPIPVGSPELINGVMRDCITQMVNILENTREVFGPKGWTALFKNVVGGSGDVKKRTRRRHRQGYSSKKY
jgi:hypothetical protein